MSSYAVVALFRPLEIGTTIRRRAWPAHITLASNFTAAAGPDRIIEVVTEAAPAAEPLSVRFGEVALFGPNHDVRVRLVESEQAVSVHMRLTDQLESLPAFVPEVPAYWRDGYRPHLTFGPTVTAAEGDSETAVSVAVVEILDSDAKVLALLHPRGAR
jgi:2'-5' RNA ligase